MCISSFTIMANGLVYFLVLSFRQNPLVIFNGAMAGDRQYFGSRFFLFGGQCQVPR